MHAADAALHMCQEAQFDGRVSELKTEGFMQPGRVGLLRSCCAHAGVFSAQHVMGMPAPFHAQASQQISQTSTEDEQAEAEERCAAP